MNPPWQPAALLRVPTHMSTSLSQLNSSATPPPFLPQTNVPWAWKKYIMSQKKFLVVDNKSSSWIGMTSTISLLNARGLFSFCFWTILCSQKQGKGKNAFSSLWFFILKNRKNTKWNSQEQISKTWTIWLSNTHSLFSGSFYLFFSCSNKYHIF